MLPSQDAADLSTTPMSPATLSQHAVGPFCALYNDSSADDIYRQSTERRAMSTADGYGRRTLSQAEALPPAKIPPSSQTDGEDARQLGRRAADCTAPAWSDRPQPPTAAAPPSDAASPGAASPGPPLAIVSPRLKALLERLPPIPIPSAFLRPKAAPPPQTAGPASLAPANAQARSPSHGGPQQPGTASEGGTAQHEWRNGSAGPPRSNHESGGLDVRESNGQSIAGSHRDSAGAEALALLGRNSKQPSDAVNGAAVRPSVGKRPSDVAAMAAITRQSTLSSGRASVASVANDRTSQAAPQKPSQVGSAMLKNRQPSGRVRPASGAPAVPYRDSGGVPVCIQLPLRALRSAAQPPRLLLFCAAASWRPPSLCAGQLPGCCHAPPSREGLKGTASRTAGTGLHRAAPMRCAACKLQSSLYCR